MKNYFKNKLLARLNNVSLEWLQQFCEQWKIEEFALFGSVLRDDFRADSDLDILVQFQPKSGWDLLDLVKMQRELETTFCRPVDLVEKQMLKNPYRRAEILQKYQVIYPYRDAQ